MKGQKRALITGVSGFTGKYVAAELAQAGYAVFGTDVSVAEAPDLFAADLLNRDELVRIVQQVVPDVVVHLAGIAFVGHGCPDDFYKVNILATRNLLEVLSLHVPQIKCVLLASSANVYGNTAGVLNETMPADPANDYAVSKLAMEYMAKLWIDRLPLVIVRPFNYTGRGQSLSFLLPKIVDHFRRQEHSIFLGNIDVHRDFSDVRFIAHVYRKLVELAPAGEIVNVCSERSHSIRNVLEMMAELAGYKIEVLENPQLVRTNEVRTLVGDASKLRRLIGPVSPVALEDTLGWMYGQTA